VAYRVTIMLRGIYVMLREIYVVDCSVMLRRIYVVDCFVHANKLFRIRFIVERHWRPHLRSNGQAENCDPLWPKFGAMIVQGDVP